MHKETSVRNTGHWLITFLKAWRISGEPRFADAARNAVNYLASDEVRPGGATFWHRDQEGKDSCNGLIGQAWTIEALATASETLERPEPAELAEEVFLRHPYDDALGLWRMVEVDGTELGFDSTFNHQLWFAAAASLIRKPVSKLVNLRVETFLDRLPQNVGLYSDGLIRHPLQAKLPEARRGIKSMVAKALFAGGSKDKEHRQRSKAVGYHAFNLYALALLATRYATHVTFGSPKIGAALSCVDSEQYAENLDANPYGYPYNPPGFEVAYAKCIFNGDENGSTRNVMEDWAGRQLRRCFDFDAQLMNRGTEDPATHAARLYEATRLPDLAASFDVAWSDLGSLQTT